MKVVVGLIILFPVLLFCSALVKTAKEADRRYEEILRRANLRKETAADGN